MAQIHSFEPIEDEQARILILGSMPGQASLKASQYYAHPQNAFWRIMGRLLDFDASAPYDLKIQKLKTARIALWDVLGSCTRAGSLDSKIQSATEVPNDFPSFFQKHKHLTHVFFNGAKAETSFQQHVLKTSEPCSLHLTRLPSTSPAHAGMSFERKLDLWRAVLTRDKPPQRPLQNRAKQERSG
jgi:TDG/mug DNA glycosylase family protein